MVFFGGPKKGRNGVPLKVNVGAVVGEPGVGKTYSVIVIVVTVI